MIFNVTALETHKGPPYITFIGNITIVRSIAIPTFFTGKPKKQAIF